MAKVVGARAEEMMGVMREGAGWRGMMRSDACGSVARGGARLEALPFRLAVPRILPRGVVIPTSGNSWILCGRGRGFV
jgi:hypothetical protein